jgi:hypothetical protein
VAEEQRQWAQAEEHYRTALGIFIEFRDQHSFGIVFASLARLWKASGDAALPGRVAELLGWEAEEVKGLFRSATEPAADDDE